MKNNLLFFVFFLLANLSFGQTPNSINYQAVIRDSLEQILTDQPVILKFTFFQNGTFLFDEKDAVQTSPFGIANTKIGDGSPGFSTIDWGLGGVQYSTELSLDGQIFEPIGGTQEFQTVPYAEHAKFAKTAGAVQGMDILFVGAMPVFGSFEGQAVIEGSDWQQVTHTCYSPYENFFNQIPVATGMTREYYLIIDYADNVAASSSAATNWRFWMDWTPAPGTNFRCHRSGATSARGGQSG